MSKDAKEKAGAELNKLKMMSSMSAEASVVRNYIHEYSFLAQINLPRFPLATLIFQDAPQHQTVQAIGYV
jgi:hypothetical protein